MIKNAIIASLICLSCLLTAQNSSLHIHVDQFGYLPEASKVAVLSNPEEGFNANLSYLPGSTLELRDANNDQVVFSASPQQWNNGAIHEQSGDKGWWFDFSTVTNPGRYYIFDPSNQEQSADFEVNPNIYAPSLKAAGRMFYYNRCGAPKSEPYAEPGWTDSPSFNHPLQDEQCRYVYDPNNANLEKDLSGGWFDAGDYNKYVTFAHDPIHNLLWAYKENPEAFGDNWNIPESGNGIPDIIDEIKWELDWLLKMNNPDGSTHIKMGSIDFAENIQAPPSANTDRRYYGPICSSASIAIASMFAHSAEVFHPFPQLADFAQLLETRAISSWNYVLPMINTNQYEEACDDGTINAGDADRNANKQLEEAVVAAIYLSGLTGESTYDQFVANHYQQTEPLTNNFWGPYTMPLTDALLYYTNLPTANTEIAQNIISSISTAASNNWNGFFGFNPADLYRSYMPDWSYHWGSNLPKTHYGILNKLLISQNINPEQHADYELKVAEQVHYFHGLNPLGLVYLSNMYDFGGDRCVNEIYHTWFADGTIWDNAINSSVGPPPGYVSGGVNASFSIASISPPANQPILKSYLDFNDGWPNNSWEISEPAIYYQAGYIRLLAWFVDTDQTTASSSNDYQNVNIDLVPNPAKNEFYLNGNFEYLDINILDNNGKHLATFRNQRPNEEIGISNLPLGVYFVQLINPKSGNSIVKKLIKN